MQAQLFYGKKNLIRLLNIDFWRKQTSTGWHAIREIWDFSKGYNSEYIDRRK